MAAGGFRSPFFQTGRYVAITLSQSKEASMRITLPYAGIALCIVLSSWLALGAPH
jgi:hypothetical protein